MALALQLVTYFSSEHLPRLFASLKAQTYSDWELYVRDQSENAAEVNRVQQLLDVSDIPFVFEAGANIGFASGHNALYSQHTADFVGLVNPDIVFEPTYYQEIVRSFSVSDWDALQGVLFTFGTDKRVIDSLGLRVLGFGDVRDLGAGNSVVDWHDRLHAQNVLPVFGVAGAAGVYRRTALEKARSTHGAFLDSRFFLYKEDVELAIRLYRSDAKSGIVVAARAEHVRSLQRRSIWMRLHHEFTRSRVVKTSNFANQWKMYLMHGEGDSSLKAWAYSMFAEVGRTIGIVMTSPRSYFRAIREVVRDRVSLLVSRREYHQRFAKRWRP